MRRRPVPAGPQPVYPRYAGGTFLATYTELEDGEFSNSLYGSMKYDIYLDTSCEKSPKIVTVMDAHGRNYSTTIAHHRRLCREHGEWNTWYGRRKAIRLAEDMGLLEPCEETAST